MSTEWCNSTHFNNMVVIDWSGKGLTDNELVKKIEELAADVECEALLLYGNNLQKIPDLTKYKQFAQLTRLCFGLIFVQTTELPNLCTTGASTPKSYTS